MDLALGDHPMETAMDAAVAALFAAAAGFAASALFGLPSIVAAAVAFLLLVVALRSVPTEEAAFPLPSFELAPIKLALDANVEPGELLLTDEHRLDSGDDELILDDVLARLGPDSRVVRLFEPTAMPTAGELKASIDNHLQSGLAPPDASQALSDALAELRRSLR